MILLLTLPLLALALFQIDFQGKAVAGCPFCDREVLERQVFYRGHGALGVLTHKPAVPGHVLIIPERHVERFEELTPEDLAALQETVKKVDAAVRKKYGNTDYLLLQKNGRMAGQTVPHVHFHYLPASRFLALRYLVSPWFKPMSLEELRQANGALSELF